MISRVDGRGWIGCVGGLSMVSLLGSCLYVGGINHAPEVQIEVDDKLSTLTLAGSAALRATASDDDDDRLTYEWRVTGQDLDDKGFTLLDLNGLLADGDRSAPVLSTAATLRVNLPVRGTYEAEVIAIDPQGAQTRHSKSFEVPNLPPMPALRLVPERATVGEHYPAHARYVVTAVDSTDPDDLLECESGASIEWELLSPPVKRGVLFDQWSVIDCQPGEVLDKLLVRGLPVGAPTEVVIRATVTDPHGATATADLPFTLQPNRPPCIRHTDPSFEVGKAVVLYHHDPKEGTGRRFDVTHVDDDVGEYRYLWKVSETEDGSYRPLPLQPGPTLILPANYAEPGATIFLRVWVQDHERREPACADQVRSCADHPALPDGCYQWVTWEVEFR